ncbi:MAG: hypothetical protein V4604_06485 [Bacteroidota bacterium]
MQSYLYLHPDRIKGIYTQFTHGLTTKQTEEKSHSSEGGISAKFFSFFDTQVKGTQSKKLAIETIEIAENMVSHLVDKQLSGDFTKQLIDQSDWNGVVQGTLIAFKGNLDFDSYGLTKEQLWQASHEEIGERTIRHDLRLHGTIGDISVEIPFSSNYIAGASQFTVLCHAMFASLEGLGVVMSDPTKQPIIIQPLAFGNGFV